VLDDEDEMAFDKTPAVTPILPKAKPKTQSVAPVEEEIKEPARALKFSDFEIMQLLGEGSFGKVFKVKKKTTGKVYAMKSMSKA